MMPFDSCNSIRLSDDLVTNSSSDQKQRNKMPYSSSVITNCCNRRHNNMLSSKANHHRSSSSSSATVISSMFLFVVTCYISESTLFIDHIGVTAFSYETDVTLPPNSTTSEDHHQYYNSTFISDEHEVERWWIDADHDLTAHEMLSNSHRRAATISLKFPFPFYGHPIKNVTIATGGFLYLGDTVHSWLAATQYIAPLMANFDTSISNSSFIKYVNNDTHFIVQWKEVHLQDSTPPGNFSFQVMLTKSGDIIFVYRDIPFPISQIPDSKHPVKVGISDAYVIDRTVFFIRRKTIYEYHRADLKKENISNMTAIYFTPLPTCNTLRDCESCVSANIPNFECKWCDAVKRCSDGFDRHRQDWLLNKCDVDSHAKDTPNRCVVRPSTTHSSTHDGNTGRKAGFLFFLILIAFVSGVGLWVFYAYKNPQTSAGQFLIKYRPAEWR